MDPLHERILSAAQKGDVEVIVSLSTEHPQLLHEARTPAGNTCLHLGAAAGSLPVVVAALERGADASLHNEQLDRPLMFACVANQPSAVHALLSHLGRLDTGRNKRGMGALELCCIAAPPAGVACLALCLAFCESLTPRLLEAPVALCCRSNNPLCLELLLRFGAALPDFEVAVPLRAIVDSVRRRAELRADAHLQGTLRDAQVVSVRAWDGSTADAVRGLSKALREALLPAVALGGARVVQALGSALRECDWDLKIAKRPPTPAAQAASSKSNKKKSKGRSKIAPPAPASTPSVAIAPAEQQLAETATDLSPLMHSLDARCAALDLRPHHFFSQALSQLSAEQRAVLLDMHRASIAVLEREEEAARRTFEDSRVEAMVDSRMTRLLLASNAAASQ